MLDLTLGYRVKKSVIFIGATILFSFGVILLVALLFNYVETVSSTRHLWNLMGLDGLVSGGVARVISIIAYITIIAVSFYLSLVVFRYRSKTR
jgi:hypothetical protein